MPVLLQWTKLHPCPLGTDLDDLAPARVFGVERGGLQDLSAALGILNVFTLVLLEEGEKIFFMEPMCFFSGEGLSLDHGRSAFKSLCLHPTPICGS